MKLLGLFFAAASLPVHAADLTSIPFKSLDGSATSLADYKGKVVLIVNTASKCGLTPQYEGLETLQKTHSNSQTNKMNRDGIKDWCVFFL